MAKKWAELQKMTASEVRAAYDATTETENYSGWHSLLGAMKFNGESSGKIPRRCVTLTWVIFFLTLVHYRILLCAIFFTTQKRPSNPPIEAQ